MSCNGMAALSDSGLLRGRPFQEDGRAFQKGGGGMGRCCSLAFSGWMMTEKDETRDDSPILVVLGCEWARSNALSFGSVRKEGAQSGGKRLKADF